MDKELILSEIRSLAAKNGGKAPGRAAFEKATGIRESVWSGKYWARWNDAIVEAGLSPNVMQESYDTDYVAEKFVGFIRELGRFPVSTEIRLKARSDTSFPSHNTLSHHLGKQSERPAFIKAYCETKGGMDDVIKICVQLIKPVSNDPVEVEASANATATGYVYLLKSGKYFKIGSTNNPDRRQYEIGLQLPEEIHHIHSIETDDPSGIEAYWHHRFKKKRLRGEWFDLTTADVKVFRRRKFM